MRRYTLLLFIAFLFVTGAVLGGGLLAGYADKHPEHPERTVTVYTTVPPEQAALLASEYERSMMVRVQFVPMAPEEIVKRVKKGEKSPDADMVLADSRLLKKSASLGAFVPFISESTDSVSGEFKDEEGAWTGVWYDPVVFCVNSDYMRTLPRIPETWAEFSSVPGMRLGMTDFLASDAAANLYFTLVSAYGDQEVFRLLSAFHPKVVQYVKYLSTPVRMTGMGEADASVAVQSETMRYLAAGYPLRMLYPRDGTAYLLTGVGLLRDDNPLAKDFAEWLLSDNAQLALQREDVYLIPANPNTLAYKQLAGKNIKLFKKGETLTPEEERLLLDRWLKTVRFK